MTPYVGQLFLVGFQFAPVDFATCSGQLVQISQFDTLFNLIGTTYGGDGQQTFGLPDLRGRTTVHQGTGFGTTSVIGQFAGVENVTLQTGELPTHTHPLGANSNIGTSNSPAGAFFSGAGQTQVYSDQPPTNQMHAGMLLPVGGNGSHSNVQPFQVCNWIISLFGIYPSQS